MQSFDHLRADFKGPMACGGCKTEHDRLRERILDLEAALDALTEDYLNLARLFDEEVHSGEAPIEERA